ncbi:MAG: DUF4166 domain-containing protein [Candidatus Berkiella sp.]
MKEKKIIFQNIFGEKWQHLPEVFKKHYAVREYSNDKITSTGTITVRLSWLTKLFSPFMSWMGILPPLSEANIPITVIFSAKPTSNAFHFERIFYYSKRKPYFFKSKMVPLAGNKIVELTQWGMGWMFCCEFSDNLVKLRHEAFVFKLFSLYIPLPLALILGKCFAEEMAVSEDKFCMKMQFVHPWFGVTYEYFGSFEIENPKAAQSLKHPE